MNINWKESIDKEGGRGQRANLMKNKLNQCNAQTMESSADDEEEFQNRCK